MHCLDIGTLGPDSLGFSLPRVQFGLLCVLYIKAGGTRVTFSEDKILMSNVSDSELHVFVRS